jgi:hypothetical protein
MGVSAANSLAFSGASGTRFAEKISLVSMYNRVLTDNEVLQNYYAMKTRFGR